MDYGRILTRAWEITWRWKILWVLGFLAGLTNAGGGGGGGGGNSNVTVPGATPGQIPGFSNFQPGPTIVALLAGLACLLLILGIVLWVLSTIARGGLIAGVAEVEDTGNTSLGRAWSAGARRFWTLFGISILAALPLILMVLMGVVGTLVAVGGISGLRNEAARGVPALATLAVCCGCGFICVFVLLALLLEQIRTYAERAAMLEGLGWTSAFARGWQVLRDNLGPTLVIWLIFLVIGLVFAAVVIGGIFALLAPVAALTGISNNLGRSLTPAWIVTLCAGGLFGVVVAAVVGSIVETFTSATWTLAYRELTRRAPASVPVEAPLG